jgi:hypothetical protein
LADDTYHARELHRALIAVDTSWLREASTLDDAEVACLTEGVGMLAEPLSSLCQRLLEGWDELDGDARFTALLVLANALAAYQDRT